MENHQNYNCGGGVGGRVKSEHSLQLQKITILWQNYKSTTQGKPPSSCPVYTRRVKHFHTPMTTVLLH